MRQIMVAMIVLFLLPSYVLSQIAATGFNDASGINSDPIPNSPYTLDGNAAGQPLSDTESGWVGSWFITFGSQAIIQSGIVEEGDGALMIVPSTAIDRRFTEAQSDTFTVEVSFRATANTAMTAYVTAGSGGPNDDGPVWNVEPDGIISVLDGEGDNCDDVGGAPPCNLERPGFTWIPDTWHTVTLVIGVSTQTYRFFFDHVEYLSPDPLGFRAQLSFLNELSFLPVTGEGVFIDNIQILEGDEAPPPCEPCQIEAGLVAGTAVATPVSSDDTISVPIEALNAPTDVDSLGFEVHFDATKLAFSGCDFTGTFLETWTFKDCNSPQPGVVVVGGFTADAGIPLGSTGPVVQLNFDVVACEGDQQYPLELQNLVDDIASWESCTGCFTCEDCNSGDVNGDGQVTPADAQIVFGCFLGQGACTPIEVARGDINRDGQLTPEDAQCIFSKFLQRPPEAQCACFLL